MVHLSDAALVAVDHPPTDWLLHSFNYRGHEVLTPQDLVVLREALAYWAKETVGLNSIRVADQSHSECLGEVTEADIQELFQRLMPENVRYIVVDSESNHAVNTRLFRNAPRIHPCSDRWQVRTVIG